MRFVDEFRNQKIAHKLSEKINKFHSEACFMEVCGTHTMTVARYALRRLLPENVKLLSGPGCPVCVTPEAQIDSVIELGNKGCIIATFGDMMKVPGSSLSLHQATDIDVRVVYSPMDALNIASTQEKDVVFFAVGFETTSPTVAATLMNAARLNLENFSVVCSHKLIPPAMRALLELGETNVNGFICPGHVSTIIGSRPYEFIPKDYGVGCVVAGFEPLDVLQSILMLTEQLKNGANVEIQYRRSVKEEGNPKALDILNKVFEPCDSEWRGIGMIPESGLKLRKGFQRFDALKRFNIKPKKAKGRTRGCICGDILRGVKSPEDCKLFGRVCTPETPVGACMVSSEGSCGIHYKYRSR